MIWLGAFYLVLSYIMIPRRPILGWIMSAIGNGLYLYPMSQLHRIDVMVTPRDFRGALPVERMARTQEAEQLDKLIRKTPFMWPDSVIHLFKSGSAAHGASGNKPTDLDVSGVYIPPVELVLGIPQMRTDEEGNRRVFDPDVQVWSTSDDNRKNSADDIDLNLYSLRKWANMAATGNTNALEFLFVGNEAAKPEIWNQYIAPHRDAFLSKRAAFHFMEFSKSMYKRLTGDATGKHGQRDDLIAEFGYDTKAAMHLLRVLEEGIELMDTHEIVLPRPNAWNLKKVRNGAYSFNEITYMYNNRMAALQSAQEKSTLPAELDRARISRIITEAQVNFWQWDHAPARVFATAFNLATKWIAQSIALAPPHLKFNNDAWTDPQVVAKDILALAMKIRNEDPTLLNLDITIYKE